MKDDIFQLFTFNYQLSTYYQLLEIILYHGMYQIGYV